MKIGRRFLVVSGAATAAVAAGVVFRPIIVPPRRVLSAAGKQDCKLTVAAVEGPYHISGVSALKDGNLNFTSLPGETLEVTGHVYEGLDSSKPVAGAEIEIWHADNTGNYHPNGNGPISNYEPSAIALRGYVVTGPDGSYRFDTIYPGEYTGRARHFHFKVRAPGKPELTTQLIVPAKAGDSLTFDTDDIAEGLPDCQLLAVDESISSANASFDFRV